MSSLSVYSNVLSQNFILITHSDIVKSILHSGKIIRDKTMNSPGISPEEASDFIDNQLKGGIGEKYVKV